MKSPSGTATEGSLRYSRSKTAFSYTEIYDGRTFIGHVIERDHGRRSEAFTAVGAPLGKFAASFKAARAVYEAATDQYREAAA